MSGASGLLRRLERWREPLLWASLALFGGWLAWRGWQGSRPLLLGAGGLLAGVALGLLVPALRQMRIAAAAPAEGVVVMREGRLGYFGPWGGGFVDLGEIERVEVSRERGRPEWVLTDAAATAVTVPFGARGAAAIPDALAGFAALDQRALAAATRPGASGRFLIWERTARPAPLRLP